MSTVTPTERDHALDATRAFALLLGVVFHGVWSFVPYDFGAPAVDVRASQVWGWFFFASHTFRMQLFFLIAGYFGRLLFLRRGFGGFATHRFKRIVMPFLVGWVVIFPTVLVAWIWGGNVTGRNLTPLPISTLLQLMYSGGLLLVHHRNGGFFGLAHLWFLYYLIILYCLAMLCAAVVRGDRLTRLMDGCIRKSIDSVGAPLWLALIGGAILSLMSGWFGVDTPIRTLVPSVSVVLLYGSFFAFGWLLHRQPELLKVKNRRWRWQIPAAILVSIPLYLWFLFLLDQGITTKLGTRYPQLTATQIRDWDAMLSVIQSPDAKSESPVLRDLLGSIGSAPTRAAIMELDSESSVDQRAGLGAAISKVILMPTLLGEGIPINDGGYTNRHKVEELLGDSITGDPRNHSWLLQAKLGYSYVYALVMWLFVLGGLGAFQDLCAGHSKAWRYIADSSYWVYLIHIPVVPVLQVWMFDWPVPSVLKCLFQLLIAGLVLFGSYHFLVRPTVIGEVLNGRRYPLRG